MKYYSSEKIRSLGCRWNWIFGVRSNGKSFDFALLGVKHYYETGKQFAWVRRMDEDFLKNRGATMFAFLECDGNGNNRIEEITGGEWNQVYYYSRCWYLARYDSELEKTIHDPIPFAYAFAVSQVYHDKGTSYPNVDMIVYDEAITGDQYLDDEFIKFSNVVSTIKRRREDVYIYMIGNTISPYCPHFQEMGLTHVKEQEVGTIQIYNVGEDGEMKVAVEYVAPSASTSKATKDKYFAFDNPKLKMITEGAWELNVYPHAPTKFTYKDVLFSFFIRFYEDLLQADVVQKDESKFLYIHRKTTPIRDEDRDLIYTTEYDPRPNYRRKLTSLTLPVERRIAKLFKAEKVFYQSNTVGEIVKNYLKWCRG